MRAFLLIILLFSSGSFAQKISRSVINYCGVTYNPEFSFSAGEGIVGSENHLMYFDNGFIQPIDLKVSYTIGIETVSNPDYECLINSPVTDKIKLSFNKPGSLFIFNIYGGEIKTMNYEDERELDVSLLKPGIYFLKYCYNDKIHVCKFIKV